MTSVYEAMTNSKQDKCREKHMNYQDIWYNYSVIVMNIFLVRTISINAYYHPTCHLPMTRSILVKVRWVHFQGCQQPWRQFSLLVLGWRYVSYLVLSSDMTSLMEGLDGVDILGYQCFLQLFYLHFCGASFQKEHQEFLSGWSSSIAEQAGRAWRPEVSQCWILIEIFDW